MSTITKDAFIPNNHKLSLEVELPPGTPTGDVVVTVIVKTKNETKKRVNRMAELEGRYKGQIWMADDFDAPLDDFAEYMW